MMLIKCQASSLRSSARMQRLRGDKPFNIHYIYLKPLSKAAHSTAYAAPVKGKCTLRCSQCFIIQCVMFNTFILFFSSLNDVTQEH